MKSKITLVLILKLSLCLTTFLSCKKVESINRTADINSLLKQVPKWLENQKSENYFKGPRNNIDVLIKNIDITKAFLINRDVTIDYLIIPIKDNFIQLKKFDSNSTMNLILLVENSKEIADAFLTQYLPSDGKKIAQLPNSTFLDIMYRKPIPNKGRYRYFDISCVLDFQITYDGEKYTTAKLKNGREKPTYNSNDSGLIKNVTSSYNCDDWYLVTTYTYDDGSIREEWVYLGRICESDDCTDISGDPVPCRGDGSTGGGGGTGDDDNVIEYINGSWETTDVDPFDSGIYSTPGFGATFGPIVYGQHFRLALTARRRYVIDVPEAWVYLISNAKVDIRDEYDRPAFRILNLLNDTSFGFPAVGAPRYAELRFKVDVHARWAWPTASWEKTDQWTYTSRRRVKS